METSSVFFSQLKTLKRKCFPINKHSSYEQLLLAQNNQKINKKHLNVGDKLQFSKLNANPFLPITWKNAHDRLSIINKSISNYFNPTISLMILRNYSSISNHSSPKFTSSNKSSSKNNNLSSNATNRNERRNKDKRDSHFIGNHSNKRETNKYTNSSSEKNSINISNSNSIHSKKKSNKISNVLEKRNREHLNRLILAMDRYFSNKDFVQMEQVWNRIIELDYLKMNTNAVNTFMKSKIIQKQFEDVESLWKKYFVEEGLEPSFRSYNIFLNHYAEQGKTERVEEIMEEMKQAGFKPNEISYTNLIKSIRNEGHLDKAIEKYEEIFISHPSEIGNSSKMLPLATTTKLLLELKGDEAFPLLRLWTKNIEIPTVMIDYYCKQIRLNEAIETFGEYFECPYFGKQSKPGKHFPMIGVYESLVECVLITYESNLNRKQVTDSELDQILNIGYDLYNSFMETSSLKMTTTLANKFIYIFVELERTEEAFNQIYRRFFVPSKSVNRRTLIKINMPTFSETRGEMLSPTQETFATLIRGASNEELEELINILQQEKETIINN